MACVVDNLDLDQLLAMAHAVVDDAETKFIAGLGAPATVHKGPGDFATQVDLAIEAFIRAELKKLTGLPVYGEEAGGTLADTMWVVDPIDGTANYAAGNPACAILVALVHQQQPVIGLISLPFFGRRLAAAQGGPLYVNGEPQPPLQEPEEDTCQIGFGSLWCKPGSPIAREERLELLTRLTATYARVRMSGAVGVDLAYVALGIYSGAITFSPHVWDNAAGVVLIRAAGGTVTGLDGQPWHLGSAGVIAGTPATHQLISTEVAAVTSEGKE